MCNIVIYQHELKAVARAMATKDVRYCLNGLMIETNGADYRLVATDGARIHIVSGTCGPMPTQEATQYIIPHDFIKAMIKAKPAKSDKRPLISITLTASRVSATLPDGTEMASPLIDGKFPDYRSITPDSLGDQRPATYNPVFLVDAYAGLAEYMEQPVSKHAEHAMFQRGNDAGVLSFGGFTALVMPLRDNVVQLCVSIDPAIRQPLPGPVALAVA